jgi:ubiquinone/menaquinone biosynthesis C-methylase UbiE
MKKEELLEPLFRYIRIEMIRKYIPKNCVLCDIGCGFNATFLRDISNSIKCGYGFDKKIKNCEFDNVIIKNLEISDKIPLDNESVDCVTLLAVVEHLDDPKKIMTESYRLLRKDGILLLTTPSPKSKPLLEFLSFRLHIVSPVEIRDHKHYFSNDELQELMETIGFRRVLVSNFEFGLNSRVIGYK